MTAPDVEFRRATATDVGDAADVIEDAIAWSSGFALYEWDLDRADG